MAIGGKIIDTNAAAKAYGTAMKVADKAPVSDPAEMSFSEFLRSTAVESIKTMRAGETMSAKAVTGQAELADVVQAVTAAELTLQTVVALRDKLVGAYQEIMRMPV